MATSIDGSLTGRGGDIIILDDLLKPIDALSDNKRKRVNEWFNNTLLSRLDDKQRGAIVVVMQRLHMDDLTGALLRATGDWTLLNLPAIAEQEEKVQIGENEFHLRRVGDILHSEREPRPVLDSIRAQLGSETFAAQYQQAPVAHGGAMIKTSWVPPTKPEGLWVLKRWAAWLDPKHPRPAKPGELRWYTTDDYGNEIEVGGRGPHLIPGSSPGTGKTIYARSRTFIPAKVTDNPDLVASGYQAMLDALPAELRAAYRDGNFQAELRDDEFQLIPTAWIRAAMDRGQADGWKKYAMTAMAVDPAGGGADAAEIAWRHGGWYAPLITVRGSETADSSAMAARVVRHRHDRCPVIVDAGGGYGGAITLRLKDNNVPAAAFNGASESTEVTRDAAKLAFHNKRAEVWWRFREALDPDQQGGSETALPPDDELKADLASAQWELTARGIKLKPKDDIRERIGRSPGKGDAMVMAWTEGAKAVKRLLRGNRPLEIQGVGGYNPHTRKYGP